MNTAVTRVAWAGTPARASRVLPRARVFARAIERFAADSRFGRGYVDRAHLERTPTPALPRSTGRGSEGLGKSGTVIVLLSLLALFTTPAARAQGLPKSDIDRLVAPAVDAQWLQSLVVGVVDEHGQQVIGYGKTAADGGVPDGDTVYEIGSVSKTFTSTILATFVKAGELSLDEPVQKLLPDTVKVPRTQAAEITLLHLATQRSGLPRMPTNFAPKDPNNPYADYSAQQMYEFISGYELPRDPGAAAMYSNLGVGLLGHALALHAGKSYEQLLIERVCEPLKMEDTRITLSASQRARLAAPFNGDLTPDHNWDLPTLAGAGAIRSTANDMLKYISAEIGLTTTELAPAMKLTQTRQAQFDAGNDIGLNWLIDTKRQIRWHNGQTGGYHSFVAFDPQKKFGVVLLSNTASGLVDMIGSQIVHQMLGEKVEPMKLPKEMALDGDALKRFVGDYKLNLLSTMKVRFDGNNLTAQITGQPAYRIYARTTTEFFWKIVSAQVTFQTDEHDAVTGAVIHQNGADVPAKKI